ncbi:MAG: hypothetical protein IJV04_02735 [Lachnospiraceae bacterium]|nr:hypothetical protein [Lachnospiraceae bacterium]
MKDADGKQMFGFGVYGGISGIQNDDGEYDDESYDRFRLEATLKFRRLEGMRCGG